MAQVGNTPTGGLTIFRLEARKAYSFLVRIQDSIGAAVDITGCEFRVVMKAPPLDSTDYTDEDNLISNHDGVITDAPNGYVQFNLQAIDLSAPIGEYPAVIVMVTPESFPVVIVKGRIEILDNPEFESLSDTYVGGDPTSTIDVMLRGNDVIDVRVGSILPPGTQYFSDADKDNLDALVGQIGVGLGTAAFENVEHFALNFEAVPGGGANKSFLAKTSDASWETNWVDPASIVPVQGIYGAVIDHGTYVELVFTSANPLNATGITDGYVPTANGAGTWGWELPSTGTVIVNADDIEDGVEKVMMTAEERDKLETVEPQVNADWDASTGVAQILNKPDVALASHTHRFLELDGVSRGTEDPVDGDDGDVVIKVPPA